MKIALVGPAPLPGMLPTGGVERVQCTLRDELLRRHSVAVIVPDSMPVGAEVLRHKETVYLPRGRLPATFSYWTHGARRVRKELSALQPDLVHFQGAAGYAIGCSFPSVVTLHGILHRDLMLRRRGGMLLQAMAIIEAALIKCVEARGQKEVAAVVVINKYIEEEMPGLDRLHCRHICNPVDRAVFEVARERTEDVKSGVVIAGRLCSRKNTLLAIDICDKAMRERGPFPVRLCGSLDDQDYVMACRNKISECKFSREFEVLGNLSLERLAVVYQGSVVLLLASLQETAPMVIAEANVLGVPVVAPKAFGVPYMVEPGINGLMFRGSDELDGAARLLEAMDKKWDGDSIAAAARRSYSPEAICQATCDLYEEVVSRIRGAQ